jgi:hypothetical protein
MADESAGVGIGSGVNTPMMSLSPNCGVDDVTVTSTDITTKNAGNLFIFIVVSQCARSCKWKSERTNESCDVNGKTFGTQNCS